MPASSLQSVGSLGIVGGSQLKSLEGMLHITEVKGSLTVSFCPRIKSLKGLGPEVASECLVTEIVTLVVCSWYCAVMSQAYFQSSL
eukprot:1158365-Pelagomonas_calceolata.AAC.16